VLCFINTKSGPQIGKDLRRKFLRILNPLQATALRSSYLAVAITGMWLPVA
jgi:hypothetical protein